MGLFIPSLRLLLAAALSCLFLPFSATAAELDFSLGTGYLSGDSTYEIGGKVVDAATGPVTLHFPISELKFPIDAWMVKAEVGVDFSEQLRATANVQTNLTDDTGKMEDSDWLFHPSQLDIYSESDTDMTAWLIDVAVNYTFFSAYYGNSNPHSSTASDLLVSYSIGLGYKYQDFDFDVSNVNQWYPSQPSLPHDRVSGLVLTYETQYQIPYIELGMVISRADKFSIGASIAYAPFVDVEDEDQHLLRDKVNKADHDWDGEAFIVNLDGRYNLPRNWFITAEVEGLWLESEGRSDAYFGGVWDHSIEHEVSAEQISGFLSLGYDF